MHFKNDIVELLHCATLLSQSFRMVCFMFKAPPTFFTPLQSSSFAFLPALLHNFSLAASVTTAHP